MSTTATRCACAMLLLAMCAVPRSAAVTQGGASERAEAATSERWAMLRGGSPELRPDYLDELDLATAAEAKIKLMYPDIGAVLGLAPQLERRLLALLSQYVLQSNERTRQDLQVAGVADSNVEYGEPAAVAITEQNAAVRLLLGTEGFWRYHAYMRTSGQRNQLRALTRELSFDPLTPEQLEDLVQLLAEHAAELEYLTFREARYPQGRNPHEQLRLFEYRQALHQQLLQRSARLLDVTQQSAFTQMQAEQLDVQRRRLGLTTNVASQRSSKPASNSDLNGVPVSWRLELSINHATPQTMTFQSVSGHSESVTTSEGLLVEAVPLIAKDNTFRVRLKVFETDGMGRHFIGNVYATGELQPAVADSAYSQSTVLSGSRGYALSLAVVATH